MDTHPNISVVIPAYNESERLPNTLQAVHNYLEQKNLSREILVVDDGSQDHTTQTVLNMQNQITGLSVISNDKNSGKGFSVRRGMLSATGDMVLMMDADQSSPVDGSQ